MHPLRLICSLMILGATALPAMAASAPPALRGKSVTVTWTETRLQRLGGTGDFSERSYAQTLNAYVSSEGRVFAKRTVQAGRKGNKRGAAASVGENSEGSQGAQFQGQTLVVTTKFAGGVRMARVSFDAGFSGCTASVVIGREGGTAIAVGRSLVDGRQLEIKSASASNVNCSVRSGNIFE